jgi:hypothetical protein
MSMSQEEYEKVLNEAMARLGELARQRDELDLQIGKLRQFIYATLNMLPDERRKLFNDAFDLISKLSDSKSASLTEAIKGILRSGPRQWFTVTQVRDHLVRNGFDFSFYASNPLASVSTTLRRMKPEEVETGEVEGVAVYRWKSRRRRLVIAPGPAKVVLDTWAKWNEPRKDTKK